MRSMNSGLGGLIAMSAVLAAFGASAQSLKPASDVNVVNSPNDPVPVEQMGVSNTVVINPPEFPIAISPGGMPVQAESRGGPCNSSCYFEIFEVPEGKMLVIEQVGMRADGLDDQDEFQWSISVPPVGEYPRVTHELGLLEKQPQIGANSQHSAGEQVKIIAGPGTVGMRASYGNFGRISFARGTISGWLYDLP